MVSVALRPARDTTGPCRFWSDPRFGWNCLALPPPVGRARASVVDEPGRGDTWQWAPFVLPRRRLRSLTEKGARPRRPTRRGAAREPEYSNKGVLAPGSGRSGRFRKTGRRFMEEIPDASLRPYMIWRAFRGWFPESQ